MSDESFAIVGGVVRGETIHMECATTEEALLTWARFFTATTLTRDQAAIPCARCGNLIGDGKAEQ